jgi:branched-subunit amino acid ABC-type transport system permease component
VSFILQNVVQIIYGPSPINTHVNPTARTTSSASIGWMNLFVIAIAVILMIALQLFVG